MTGTDGRVQVVLGEHTYTPSPQKAGYIEHVLWPGVQEVFSAAAGETPTEGEVSVDSGNGSAFTLLRERAYDLLKLFMPDDPKDPSGDLMPKFEFLGYGSEEAYVERRYVEADDTGPTIPEIGDAIEFCLTLNGGKVADYLKVLVAPERLTQLFSPAVVQGMGNLMVAKLAEVSKRN